MPEYSSSAAGLSGTLENQIKDDAPLLAVIFGATITTTRRTDTVFAVDVVYRNGDKDRLVVTVEQEKIDGVHDDQLQDRQGPA